MSAASGEYLSYLIKILTKRTLVGAWSRLHAIFHMIFKKFHNNENTCEVSLQSSFYHLAGQITFGESFEYGAEYVVKP